MKKLVITIIILIGFMPIATQASDNFTINGYYKNFFVVYDVSDYVKPGQLSDDIIGMVSSRIRLDSRLILDENISLSVSYGIAPRVQDKYLSLNQFGYSSSGGRRYRMNDFYPRLYPPKGKTPENFVIYHNLDRAFLSISINSLDIIFGRQAIAWGSARAVNPTDVIAPYSFDELDSEERTGVDAIRFRLPIGFMGEFDAGYLFGNDFKLEESAFYLRSKFYAARTDFSFLVLGFRENLLVGFDLTRAIGGAGFWLETAYVIRDALVKGSSSNDSNYLRSTIGFDYSFGGLTYGSIEYHYNQAGENKPEDYFASLTSSAYTEGSVYLMGQHYLIPAISYQITPLVTFTGQFWWNLSDYSFLITPYIEYNIAENIYLAGGGYIGIGKSPLFTTDQIINYPIFKSEFGSYTNSLFTSFRVYF